MNSDMCSAPSDAPPAVSSASPTILVVDDDPAGRYARKRPLERAGFSVLEAGTGTEALSLLRERLPALVVLDIKLPDVDGFAVCRAIREDPATATIMVLQISAYYTTTSDHVHALEHGADAYLAGDVSPPLLIATVRALLRARRAEQALREMQERERQRLAAEVQATGTALDRTKDELRALAASLLTAQQDEGRRIARELHDDLMQQLAALEIDLTNLRHLDGRLSPQLDAAIQRTATLSNHIRRISHRLHPSVVEHLGLDAALRSLCEEFESLHGMPIHYSGHVDCGRLPPLVLTALYRIAQEALRNVQKHAGDARTTVTLTQADDELVLTIRDDGSGFDPARTRSSGLGLLSIEERARLAGGRMLLHSAPGEGTELQVRIPMPASVAPADGGDATPQ